MPNWDEIQTKAKKMIDDGLELLKKGAHDGGLIAGATAQAAKLHYAIQKRRVEIHKAYHLLGNRLYAMAREAGDGKTVVLTDELVTLCARVKELEEQNAADLQKLGEASVVHHEPKNTA